MRFPSITAQTIASPRIVYLKGADVRLSANDEPETFATDCAAIQARDEDALLEQVQRMRIEGAI